MIKKYYSSLFISLPFVACFCAFSLTYNVDQELWLALPLFGAFSLLFIMDYGVSKNPSVYPDKLHINVTSDETQVLLFGIVSAFIILMGIADLVDHGVVILNPLTYSVFLPHQAWVRHFSSLCWILGPIALCLPFSKMTKLTLLFWAFFFPVLVVDRNRLLMAFFSTVLSLYFIGIGEELRKRMKIISVFSIILAITCFIILGQKRAGEFSIHNQYAPQSAPIPLPRPCNLPRTLPAKEAFKNLSAGFQWIFLYTTTPVYNLSVQYKCETHDTSLLKAQLIPLWKKSNTVGAPYLVAYAQNAGTELMPFYMFFGAGGIFLALILEYLILRYAFYLYMKDSNIFNFLIVLRLSYCALFAGFAPQFFTWTTLGFIFVIKACEYSYRYFLATRLRRVFA